MGPTIRLLSFCAVTLIVKQTHTHNLQEPAAPRRMPRARVFSFTSSTSSFSSSLSSTSSTTGNSSSDPDDDDDEDYAGHSRSRKTKTVGAAAAKKPAPAATSRAPLPRGQNILLRVLQRERTGFLSCRQSVRSNQQRLAAVPSGLSFCLQDIVPYCYLTG